MDQQHPDQNQTPGQPDYQSSSSSQPSGGFSRHSKTLLTLLLVSLLIAGAAWFFMGRDALIEEAGEDGPQVEIAITEDGFMPETILVNPGTTITWVNESDDPIRVASNPHPDHDGLDGLDSQEAIGPGATYTFVFEAAGEFGYHDHYNPETNGTVVVEKQE